MRIIIRIIDGISGLFGWFAGLMAVIALMLTLGEILLRGVFSKTLYITDEYTGYLMTILTFMGFSYTMRERGHIRMTLLRRFLKGKSQAILEMVCFLIGFTFVSAMTYFTFQFFWDSCVNQTRSMQISETYLAIPQVFMPLGSAAFALQFLGELLKEILFLRGRIADIKKESEDFGR
ncbi:MAG: TRAP transporter small permease [Syntrophales bacterium]|nr:TRAP transporter small permease [Syntrophales bacterium]